jgi:dephospho-CoA kinase
LAKTSKTELAAHDIPYTNCHLPMLIIGLTGGIASGKSTTSRRLAEKHNLLIVDADVIARQVVEPGTRAYKRIVTHFSPLMPDGETLLDPENGSLNRPALGRAVFGNEEQRKMLNSIVHPAVRLEMAREVVKAWITGHRVIVLDVPLLLESKLDQFCGVSVVVACNDDLQQERLLQRDEHLSRGDAQKRIASQLSMDEKRARADYVVENDGTLDDLYDKIDKLVDHLRPNSFLSLLEWLLPPVGFIMALYVFLRRKIFAIKPKLA